MADQLAFDLTAKVQGNYKAPGTSQRAAAYAARYAHGSFGKVRTRTTAPVPQIAPVIPPPPSGIPLEALTKTTCRWPLLDRAPQLFCGAHADGRYCKHHSAKSTAGNQGRMA